MVRSWERGENIASSAQSKNDEKAAPAFASAA